VPFGKSLPAFKRMAVPSLLDPSSQNRVDFEMAVTIYPKAQRNITEIDTLRLPLCKHKCSKVNYVWEEQNK
jgi:hypothetical protein